MRSGWCTRSCTALPGDARSVLHETGGVLHKRAAMPPVVHPPSRRTLAASGVPKSRGRLTAQAADDPREVLLVRKSAGGGELCNRTVGLDKQAPRALDTASHQVLTGRTTRRSFEPPGKAGGAEPHRSGPVRRLMLHRSVERLPPEPIAGCDDSVFREQQDTVRLIDSERAGRSCHCPHRRFPRIVLEPRPSKKLAHADRCCKTGVWSSSPEISRAHREISRQRIRNRT